tara:strand:- start:157 stop:864 length:708 start_codon:yes stop_codon:yes gene_type:complete
MFYNKRLKTKNYMNSKLFIVGILILILNSCQVVRFKNNTKNKFSDQNKPSYIDLSSKKIFAKGKIKFNNTNQQQGLNVSIKTNKDSIIMFSALAPLGIEVVRGQIANDTLYFIDRVNKKYQITALNSLNIIDISSYSVKDMVNALFVADYSIAKQKEKIRENQIEKENTFFKEILGKQQAKISYSNYRYVENIKIPFSLVISAENKEINLDYTHVSFLDKLKIKKFKIPKGYEKL